VVGYASFELWWQTGGLIVLLGDVLGVGTYALITVYGRVLAIALAPSLSPPVMKGSGRGLPFGFSLRTDSNGSGKGQ